MIFSRQGAKFGTQIIMIDHDNHDMCSMIRFIIMKNVFIILILSGLCACHHKDDNKTAKKQEPQASKPGIVRPVIPYQSFIADCKQQVTTLQKQHKQAELQDYIYSIVSNKMPAYWHGTTWDFNGTTRKAGEESIACGYFITTILEDIGLKINRNKMAQEPSSVLIKATCNKIKTYATMEQLKQYLSNVPSHTILLAGLDFHTGFIIKENDSAYFFHSNYIAKQGVVKEPVETSRALNASKSFMVGILSRNSDYIFK